MSTVGIIAEYNPLHNGHVYHINKSKEMTGSDHCVVAMSGNFVQRGEPACLDKYKRAVWAVKSGVDFVFEIPNVYVLSSAEKFAYGGVQTLLSTGIVTHIAFGCETDNIDGLYKLAEILSVENEDLSQRIKNNLKTGISYPNARYNALIESGIPKELVEITSEPNNILAIEYLKAIKRCNGNIIPVPIHRQGTAYNDVTLKEGFVSSTAIRNALINGDADKIVKYIPEWIYKDFIDNEDIPITDAYFTDILLFILNTFPREYFCKIQDVSEGIENKILKAAKETNDYEQLLHLIKSKRFTMSRLKRIMMNILLQNDETEYASKCDAEYNNYLHLLSMNSDSKTVLSKIAENAGDNLIIQYSDVEHCSSAVRKFYEKDAYSTDIYNIVCPYKVHRDCYGPIII